MIEILRRKKKQCMFKEIFKAIFDSPRLGSHDLVTRVIDISLQRHKSYRVRVGFKVLQKS